MIITNINSRIDWQNGMEVSPQTFIEFDENITKRQQIASRVANGNLFGIIPFTEFLNQGVFVKNTLEIAQLSCMALLRSGQVLHIDQPFVVQIPMLYGEEYYLAGGFGEAKVGFDKETVPFVRPEYSCGIYTAQELDANYNLFPLMKFRVNSGVFSIDKDYIPPYLMLSSSVRFQEFTEQYIEKIKALAEHSNLESGDAQRALIRYVFVLKNYSQTNRVVDFIQLMQEIVQSVDYYVITPNTESPTPIEQCSLYDVGVWLKWVVDYINGAASVLDKVVLIDHSLDFEKLKAEVKAELYTKLYPELKEQLYTELKEQLYTEITEKVMAVLSDYINGKFKETLHEQLNQELATNLYGSLYPELYENLYNALYVPIEVEEEQEEFIPLI